jgi:hypothetical protein
MFQTIRRMPAMAGANRSWTSITSNAVSPADINAGLREKDSPALITAG